MVDENRFFKLAKKWKRESNSGIYILILKEVMNYHFDCITACKSKDTFVMDGIYYSLESVKFVLNSLGYRNYKINQDDDSNKIIVTFSKQ